MAKSLRQPPPSSSVARLLDPQAVRRATEPPLAAGSEEPAHPPLRGFDSTDERFAKREFTLSKPTDQTFCRLLELYRRETGTRLTASQLFRAMLRAAAPALPCVEGELQRIGRLRLPGNARDREGDRVRFEQRLAAAFAEGMRRAPVWSDS